MVERDERERENEALRRIMRDFHWMGRRYCDGWSSSVARLFNRDVRELTRELVLLGVRLHLTSDNTLFARDGMGRDVDGLTPEQVAEMEAAETAVPAQMAGVLDRLRHAERERDVLLAWGVGELSGGQAVSILDVDYSQLRDLGRACLERAEAAWREWREQHPPEVTRD